MKSILFERKENGLVEKFVNNLNVIHTVYIHDFFFLIFFSTSVYVNENIYLRGCKVEKDSFKN